VITVLRIGHRPERDKRVTTHICLTARALGASAVLVDRPDPTLEQTVRGVVARFGGDFRIETGVEWRKVLRSWDGPKVHLTMYGERVKAIEKIPRRSNLLVLVGAEKVPPDAFRLADLNLAVGNQPHSEVAALAVFLDRYTQGSWTRKRLRGKLTILPSARGKRMADSRR